MYVHNLPFTATTHIVSRGSIALSTSGDRFVSWTGEDRFQMYRWGSLELLQTFSGSNPALQYSLQVCFAEKDQVIVGGSSRGCAFVFQSQCRDPCQTLQYPLGGLVQTIAVRAFIPEVVILSQYSPFSPHPPLSGTLLV